MSAARADGARTARAPASSIDSKGARIGIAIRHYAVAPPGAVIRGVTICWPPSHVDVDVVRAQLHEFAPRRRLALAHQLGDLALGALGVEAPEPHLEQAP